MSSILSALHIASATLKAFDQALVVTQNNVANASTPGFVQQTQTFTALPFDIQNGLIGGTRAGQVMSSRDQYAEQAVWQQSSLLGQAQQNASSLTSLQTYFDISGSSGISSAMNGLFQSFSAWGQTPTDINARQTVLNQADDVANVFQQASANLSTVTENTNGQLNQSVTEVNQLVTQLKDYNTQILSGDRNDAGLDAQLYSTLEQLSQYVDITGAKQADGSVTVLMGGQTPLLVGDQQYQLTYQLQQPTDPAPLNPNGPPLAHILSSSGEDVTGKIASGQLGALLNLRNTILPSYIGDAYQQGDLNVLAQQFADRVNQILTAGNIVDGTPAAPDGTGGIPAVTGVPLFVYDTNADGTVNATNVAATLAVNPGITTSQLAAIDPGPPEVTNGVPLALANLATPHSDTDEIGGVSYTQYYGNLAARVGSALTAATSEQQVRQSSLAQVQNLRQQQSGVSLDEEAMTLVEFQRAYEANSRLITVLNEITQSTINILSTTS